MTLDHLRAFAGTFVPLALRQAMTLHADDKRKDGSAYLGHLLAVASQVADDPAAMIAALLHDTVEDHPDAFDLGDVCRYYGEEMAAVVDALSHRPNEPRVAYIDRVIDGGPVARRVKLADLTHNFTHLEDDGVSVADRKRLRGKYLAEIEALAPLVMDDSALPASRVVGT